MRMLFSAAQAKAHMQERIIDMDKYRAAKSGLTQALYSKCRRHSKNSLKSYFKIHFKSDHLLLMFQLSLCTILAHYRIFHWLFY